MHIGVFKSKNYRFLSEIFYDQKIDIFDQYIGLKYIDYIDFSFKYHNQNHWIIRYSFKIYINVFEIYFRHFENIILIYISVQWF